MGVMIRQPCANGSVQIGTATNPSKAFSKTCALKLCSISFLSRTRGVKAVPTSSVQFSAAFLNGIECETT